MNISNYITLMLKDIFFDYILLPRKQNVVPETINIPLQTHLFSCAEQDCEVFQSLFCVLFKYAIQHQRGFSVIFIKHLFQSC